MSNNDDRERALEEYEQLKAVLIARARVAQIFNLHTNQSKSMTTKSKSNSNSNSKTHFPAFPFPGFAGAAGIPAKPSNSGMSFRDFVAVQAMSGGIARPSWTIGEDRNDAWLCEWAYKLADKMIAAREATS